MLSILGNRKIIVSILTMAFLIVGVQGVSYAQLSVTSEVSPTSVAPGGSFTLTATIRNGPTAQSAGITNTVNFYKSSAATINASDDQVGSVIVGALGANVARMVSISMPAPSDMETYYYGAGVGAGVSAVFSNGARLTVTNARPNLTVSLASPYSYYDYSYYDPAYNPYGPYNQIALGGRITLQATVTNIGNGASTAGATLEVFYRPTASSSNYISVTPADITPATVRALAPRGTNGHRSTHNISLLVPTTPGIHEYYVRVNPVPGDGAQRNSNIVRINTALADLTVGTPTVDKSTLAPGESFTLTAIVRNNGSASSSNATLQFYSSTDSTIDATDTPIGTPISIGRILSGRDTSYAGFIDTSTQAITLNAPTTPGNHYYGAYVSGDFGDINTQNNYSAAVAITVSAPPDLVAEILELRTNTAAPRDRLTLDATVTNQGEGQSPSTYLRFYESTDRRFTREDEIDRVSVGALASNRSSNVSIRLIAPDIPGTYYYRVEVDTVPNEESPLNNTSGYIVIVVEAPLTLESVSPSKSTLSPGERFTLTATVRNDGTTTSARTAVEFYSSADNTITSRDTSIGRESVSAITARGTSQVSHSLTAPNTPGTYYYGACISDSTGSCEVVRITVIEETIVANLERPPIYWVSSDGGSLQSLTGSEVEPFVRNVRNANSIAVDREGGKVYWTEELGTNRGRVWRANLDGRNVEVVRELQNAPRGIAIDPSKGKLYVTNVRGNIHKMNLDGTLFHWNFIVDLTSPGGIAVDAAGGKVYWTEDTGNERGRVRRANLNGTNIEPVRTLASVPRGIAIDPSKGKLYVPNARGNIHKMNLDGTLFHWDFITGLDSPQGVAVDAAAGKLYWTEAGKIRRANLNGRNLEDVATGIGAPAGIALSVAPVSMEAPAAPSAAAVASDATALHANYPNPFNPETWIPYQLQTAADVTVTIHDIRGMIVRELSLGHQPAGVYQSRSHAAYWDGRNKLGEPVASGLYFYTLTAGDFTATRKMLIRK